MIAHSIVFQLGSLEVFRKRDLTLDISSSELPGFYWLDKHVTKEQGPFPSIHQAMEHYTVVEQQRRSNVIPLRPIVDPTVKHEGKLIVVDFKARKRIG